MSQQSNFDSNNYERTFDGGHGGGRGGQYGRGRGGQDGQYGRGSGGQDGQDGYGRGRQMGRGRGWEMGYGGGEQENYGRNWSDAQDVGGRNGQNSRDRNRQNSKDRNRTSLEQAGHQQQRHLRGNQHPNAESDLAAKKISKEKFRNTARENYVPAVGYNANQRNRPRRFLPVSFSGTPDPGVLQNLQTCLHCKRSVPTVSLDQVINKSFNFWDIFTSETARLDSLRKAGMASDVLQEYLQSVYPIVHHATLKLMLQFLDHKTRYGSNTERKLYSGMNLIEFVDRLLKRRPLSFLGENDQYLLPPPSLKHGYGGFESIGTDNEKHLLVLEDFLSYDEMRIAALVSLSSWSVFVNDGERKNYGKEGKPGTFQPTGVICGQVGARLKKAGVMEYQDCVINRKENIISNGFGVENQRHINAVWGNMWGSHLPTYEEANETFLKQRDGVVASVGKVQFEYMPIGKDFLFNVTVYKKRILITAEILLCEAAARAEASGKNAYIHVVGLGLGVWRASNKQDELFIEAWGDALHCASNTGLISDIDFSWIGASYIHGVKSGEKFPKTDITIHFSKRNIHDRVPEDCILVCNYAWDGNSLPGNEFWLGKSCSTGDSAAACSSCVAEIHNHLLNPTVCADALRVATKEGRLVPWQEYPHGTSGNTQAQPIVTLISPDSASSQVNTNEYHAVASEENVKQSPAPQVSGVKSSAWSQMSHSTSDVEPNYAQLEQKISAVSIPSQNESDKVAKSDVIAQDAIEKKEPAIPEEIPHPTIPGLTIPNPLFKKKASKKTKANGHSDGGKPSEKKNKMEKNSPTKNKPSGKNANSQQKSSGKNNSKGKGKKSK